MRSAFVTIQRNRPRGTISGQTRMSHEIDFGVSGPLSAAEARGRLDDVMDEASFEPCGPPTGMFFDSSAGMYVHADDHEPIEGMPGQKRTWDDGHLQLSLTVAAMAENAVNLWITASARNLGRLFLRDQSSHFFKTVGRLADAVNAPGGYGGVDLLYEPLALEDIAAAIHCNPQSVDGAPPDLAITSRQRVTQQARQASVGEERLVIELSETHLFLVERDFESYIRCFSA